MTEPIAGLQQHITFVDSTFKLLLTAQHTEVMAWNLATYLGTRVFKEVAEPRNGMSISTRAVRPDVRKCASLI